MIFTCAAAAIDTMLTTPITSSKSATTVREGSSNVVVVGGGGTRLRRKKRRSSGIDYDSSSTPKSHPSTSKLHLRHHNPSAADSYSCSDLSLGITSPSELRPSIYHSNGADPPLSLSTAPSKRRVSASRGAFSGTLKAMDDFELLEVLAEGFFGTVYKVREKANRAADPIVMKVPIMRDQQPNFTPKKDKKVADWEAYLLNELADHPNILKSKGLCVDQTSGHWHLNLLVEFCDRGTLQQAIIGGGVDQCVVNDGCDGQHSQQMPWHHVVHIGRDISDAMAYMHTKGFFHRDLTSMNVLLKSQPSSSAGVPMAVVADLGLAARIPQNSADKLQQVGTADWKAPEVLSDQYYDEKSDLFSFGIILCQMIAATDADPDKGVFRTKSFGIDFAKFCAQKCPKDVPIELLKCAKMCCRFRPDKRPSFAALLQRFCAQCTPTLVVDDHRNNNADSSTNNITIVASSTTPTAASASSP